MKNVLLAACAVTLVLTGCGSDNHHSYNTATKPTAPTVKPSAATPAYTTKLVNGKDMFHGVIYNKFKYDGTDTPFDYIHKIQANDHQVKTAKYEGTALVRVGQGPLIEGTSKFDVNFGNATNGGTISGEIKYANETIKLQNGKIRHDHYNNEFESKDGSVEFDGAFFGATAGELGGKFKDGTREGSFGASKK